MSFDFFHLSYHTEAKSFFRVAVLEANYFVAQIVTSYGFDVLDMHYYFRALLEHR